MLEGACFDMAEGFMSKHEVNDDYFCFDDENRKKIITEYVKFIQGCNFTPVKVLGAKDPNEVYSFRAIFQFNREIMKVKRLHTTFFISTNNTDFSLKFFYDNVIDGSNRQVQEFKKQICTRVFNTGVTEEEVLCALLADDLSLRIEDVYKNGRVVIPDDRMLRLFDILMMKGSRARQITRHHR